MELRIEDEGEEEVSLYQKMPVTKVFLDDDYLILGHADGTTRVYGAGRLNLITQVNLSAQTMHPSTTKLNMGAVMQMPLKVSFIARHKDFIITTALEPDTKQLEMSVWALKGSYSVFPLRRRVIGGTVTCVHYDKTQNTVIVVTSIRPKEEAAEISMIRFRLEMKALTSSLSKWKSTNEADQVKLAEELIQEVTTNDLLYQVFMKLPFSAACSDVMAESLYLVLKDNPECMKSLVNIALNYELDRLVRMKNGLLAPSSAPNSRPMSARNSKKTLEDKLEKSTIDGEEVKEAKPDEQEPSKETDSGSSSDDSVSSDEEDSPRGRSRAPSQGILKNNLTDNGANSGDTSNAAHWTQGCLSSSVLSHYLVNRCHLFSFVALSDPLSLLAKAEGKFIFTVDAVDETNPQNLRMLKRLTNIVSAIIDNIIAKDMHLPRVAVDLLADFHARLRTAQPDIPELRAMKVGAGRLFVTHFILAAWLEPVKFGISSKMPSDLNNMYVVAQLLEIVCLGGPEEVIGSVITAFKEEQSLKFRTWFLNKVRSPERHIDAAKKKNSSFTIGSSAVSKKDPGSSSSSSKAPVVSRGGTLVMIQAIIAYQHDIVTELTSLASGIDLSGFSLGGPAWLRDIQTAGSSLLYNSAGANAALANVRAMNVAAGASAPAGTDNGPSPYSTAYSSPSGNSGSSTSLVSGALSGRSAFKNTSSTMTPTDSTAAFVKTMSTYLLTPIQKMMNKEVLKDDSVSQKLELFSEAQHALDGVSHSGYSSNASSSSMEATQKASMAFRAELDERRRESRPRLPLSVGSSSYSLVSLLPSRVTPPIIPRGSSQSGDIPTLSLGAGSSTTSSSSSKPSGESGEAPVSGGRKARFQNPMLQRRTAHHALDVDLSAQQQKQDHQASGDDGGGEIKVRTGDVRPGLLRQSPSAKAQLERSKVQKSSGSLKKIDTANHSPRRHRDTISGPSTGSPKTNLRDGSTRSTSGSISHTASSGSASSLPPKGLLLNSRAVMGFPPGKLGQKESSSSSLLDSAETSSNDASDDASSVSSNVSADSDEPVFYGPRGGNGRNAISLSRNAGRRILRLAAPSAPPIPSFSTAGGALKRGETAYETPSIGGTVSHHPPARAMRRHPALTSIFATASLTYSTDSPADAEP